AQSEPSLVGTWVITSTRAGSVPNGILVTVLPQGGFLRTGRGRAGSVRPYPRVRRGSRQRAGLAAI
ncbi:MAG TPA: hypothetical protein VFA49_07825, partial [Chloroflexota bacterium]|nr:hypothetical protein [Chloroflexota bacterium]